MLGLSDLSGEVMRRCITSLGNGDIDTCFEVCEFLRQLYSGYIINKYNIIIIFIS